MEFDSVRTVQSRFERNMKTVKTLYNNYILSFIQIYNKYRKRGSTQKKAGREGRGYAEHLENTSDFGVGVGTLHIRNNRSTSDCWSFILNHEKYTKSKKHI